MGKKLNTSYARTGTKICRPTFFVKTKETKPINKISRKAYCLLSHTLLFKSFCFRPNGSETVAACVVFLLFATITHCQVFCQNITCSQQFERKILIKSCRVRYPWPPLQKQKRALFFFSDYILSDIKPPGWRSYSPVR